MLTNDVVSFEQPGPGQGLSVHSYFFAIETFGLLIIFVLLYR